jgi:hypothetical protein
MILYFYEHLYKASKIVRRHTNQKNALQKRVTTYNQEQQFDFIQTPPYTIA